MTDITMSEIQICERKLCCPLRKTDFLSDSWKNVAQLIQIIHVNIIKTDLKTKSRI